MRRGSLSPISLYLTAWGSSFCPPHTADSNSFTHTLSASDPTAPLALKTQHVSALLFCTTTSSARVWNHTANWCCKVKTAMKNGTCDALAAGQAAYSFTQTLTSDVVLILPQWADQRRIETDPFAASITFLQMVRWGKGT